MKTWRVLRTLARARLERDGQFWATPIYPSVGVYRKSFEDRLSQKWDSNADLPEPPAVIEQIKFELVTRAGVRIVECEGIMVEAWS